MDKEKGKGESIGRSTMRSPGGLGRPTQRCKDIDKDAILEGPALDLTAARFTHNEFHRHQAVVDIFPGHQF